MKIFLEFLANHIFFIDILYFGTSRGRAKIDGFEGVTLCTKSTPSSISMMVFQIEFGMVYGLLGYLNLLGHI